MMSSKVLVMFITSIGELLNLFEFHCLEYKVFFLLNSHCGVVFIITVFYFFLLTLIFLKSLVVVLCFVSFCFTGVYVPLG